MRRGIELLRGERPSLRRTRQDCLCRSRSPGRRSRARHRESRRTLATCERIGHRTFEAELHRVRGEMLLKRDPPTWRLPRKRSRPQSPSLSVKARAASSCARRSRSPSSINRPPDRRRPRRPRAGPRWLLLNAGDAQIAEAQALLAALSEAEEVKNGEARRRQRLQLQTGYAQAVAFSKASWPRRPKPPSIALVNWPAMTAAGESALARITAGGSSASPASNSTISWRWRGNPQSGAIRRTRNGVRSGVPRPRLVAFCRGDFRSAQTALGRRCAFTVRRTMTMLAACSDSIPWQARWLTSPASTSFAASFRRARADRRGGLPRERT